MANNKSLVSAANDQKPLGKKVVGKADEVVNDHKERTKKFKKPSRCARGICWEFVNEVLKKSGAMTSSDFNGKWGEARKNVDEACPGDIVVIKGYRYVVKKRVDSGVVMNEIIIPENPGHIGILREFWGGVYGNWSIAEQNMPVGAGPRVFWYPEVLRLSSSVQVFPPTPKGNRGRE